MAIDDVHLYGGGEYIYNHFKDSQDTDFAMLPDRIGALVIDHVSKPIGDCEVLIGCADRMIRYLTGAVIKHELPVEGSVTALVSWSNVYEEYANLPTGSTTMGNGNAVLNNSTGNIVTRTRYFVYGCSTGHVGFFGISSSGGFIKYWSFLPNELSNANTDTTIVATTGIGVSNISIFPMSNQSLVSSPTASNSSLSSSSASSFSSSSLSTIITGPEIIVGRENGQLEIYALDNIETLPGLSMNTSNTFMSNDNNNKSSSVNNNNATSIRFDTTVPSSGKSMSTVPRLLGSTNVQESIRCIGTGCITNIYIPEIFVLTFSGRLMSFTTEKLTEIDKEDNTGRSKETVQRQAQIKNAKKEIEDLRKEVSKQKEKLDKLRVSSTGGSASTVPGSSSSLSLTGQVLIPTYPVVTNFSLNIDEGLYYLTIELPIPIEYVILQSTVPLNLPDTESSVTSSSSPPGSEGSSFNSNNHNNKNKHGNNTGTVITLVTVPDIGKTNTMNQYHSRQIIAMARPIDNLYRITVRVRLIEGEAGEIISMVIPTANPKASIVSRIPIKPLCLYDRLTESPEDIEKRLNDAWNEFYVRRKQDQDALNNANSSTTASSTNGSNTADDDDLHRPTNTATIAKALSSSGTGADDTSLAAQASAFSMIAKSSMDPQVTAAALALKSLTPAQTANLGSVPPSFPWSILRISGTFTLSQMHEWIGNCLPDIPARLIADGRTEAVDLGFRNIFVGSHLITRYTKGNATFASDNPTTISILRDALNNAASAVKVRLNVTINISPFAARHILSLIHPRLMYSLTLNLRAELSEAVKEMISADTNPGGTTDTTDNKNNNSSSIVVPPYLHPEFADVYTNGDKYASEMGSGGSNADALFGIITDMFVDCHKLQGNDVTNKITSLTNLLPQYHVSIDNHPTTRYLQRSNSSIASSIRGSELIASCIENPVMLMN